MMRPSSMKAMRLGDMGGEAHLVGDDEHRHAFGREALHHLQHFADQLGIERRGWLVEQHEAGLHRQRPGDGDALLLAARETRRIGVGLGGEPDPGQHRHCAIRRFAACKSAHAPERLGDIAERRHMRPKIEVLEHHADLAPHLAQGARRHWPARSVGRVLVADQPAVDAQIAGIVRLQEIHASEQRALARPAGPNQADDLRAPDREVDVAKHLMRAKALADLGELDHRRAHALASCARNAVTRVSTREPRRDTASTRSQ